MKATDAIRAEKIKPLPGFTQEMMIEITEEKRSNSQSIHVVRYPFNKIHQGKFHRFVQVDTDWYKLEDEMTSDSSAVLTLDNLGEYYRCVSNDGDTSDSHDFLAWVFINDSWIIKSLIHSLMDETDFDK